MATVQNVLIGRSSGSVGGTVFLTYKGVNVTRSKPLFVTNPQTFLQTQQRYKFSFLRDFYNKSGVIINQGFVDVRRKQSLLNAFMSLNIKAIFTNNYPNMPILIPDSIVVSRGLYTGVKSYSFIAHSASNDVTFVVETVLYNKAKSTDKGSFLVWNETKNTFFTIIGFVQRTVNNQSFSTYLFFDIGDVVHSWLYFTSVNGNEIAGSQYSKCIVV